MSLDLALAIALGAACLIVAALVVRNRGKASDRADHGKRPSVPRNSPPEFAQKSQAATKLFLDDMKRD